MSEYLSLLIRQNPHDIDKLIDVPKSAEASGSGSGGLMSPEKEREKRKGKEEGLVSLTLGWTGGKGRWDGMVLTNL